MSLKKIPAAGPEKNFLLLSGREEAGDLIQDKRFEAASPAHHRQSAVLVNKWGGCDRDPVSGTHRRVCVGAKACAVKTKPGP